MAAWPVAALAQPSVRQIGYVGSSPRQSGAQSPFDCFNAGLEDLGWKDGRNISITYKLTDNSSESFARIAGDLVNVKPDIIVATSTSLALAMKAATEKIPIVFISVSDPVATGIVKSLARPGGNITGVSNFLPATAAKLLELLLTVKPTTSRVGVLFDPTNMGKLLEVEELRVAASILRVQLIPLEVRTAPDIERTLPAAVSAGCDGLITLVDGVTFPNRTQITEFVSRQRLLGIYQVSNFVDGGGLMSYGLNYCRHYRRAASYVDRILKGAQPADLPIELPTEFELVINMKVAKALGVEIPPTLLARADLVLE